MKSSYQPSSIIYHLILVVASSLLLALSFPNFNLYYLIWIGLVPLFFVIENQRPLKAFLLSYLTGILFFSLTIYWLIHVTLPGAVIIVLYSALYFGLFGLITTYHLPLTTHRLLFFTPALWVTLEFIRSHFLSGFGWALLAHSQTRNLPIIQIADCFGAYGVSFLIVMVNAGVFLAIKNFRKKEYRYTMPLVTALFFLFISLAYGAYRLNNIFTGARLRITAIQGNIPQEEKWADDYREKIIDKYERLTKEAAKEGADLIIWPETSVPGYLESERDILDRLKSLAKSVNIPVLVGAPREDKNLKETFYNSAFLFGRDGQIIDRYDKIHLVPFGEYVPFKDALSFVENFAPLPIGNFSKGGSYTVFNFFVERQARGKNLNWRLTKNVKFSCLICFEDIFPHLTRGFVKNGSDFLVNITNDAWFKDSSAPYQHAQSSVFRAVENRTNVVRVANTGFSCFIDQKGRIVGSVEKNGKNLFIDGFKTHEITLTKTRTFYSLYGDVFAYACVIFTAVFILGSFFRKK